MNHLMFYWASKHDQRRRRTEKPRCVMPHVTKNSEEVVGYSGSRDAVLAGTSRETASSMRE